LSQAPSCSRVTVVKTDIQNWKITHIGGRRPLS
jgi:hypothetical protein